MPASLKQLIEESRTKYVPKDQIIFHSGDEPKEAFMVKEGVVKVYDIDETGNEKILHLVSASGVIPLSLFSGGTQRTQWFYTPLINSELYRIPFDALQQTMTEDCDTTLHLMHWFSREVHELLKRLDSMGRTNVKDKLLAALKFLADRHSQPTPSGWSRVKFPVSHQLLADMTGITRESAATAMKELTDAGLVRSPRLTVLEIYRPKLEPEE